VYYFSAPLHSSRGGPVTGEVFGSKTLIKPATDAKLNLEQRATLLIFTFGNREDQIVVMGVPDYPPNAAEFNAGQPVVRAVLGGNRQVHRSAWSVDQYAGYGRFIYAGVYVVEVMQIENWETVPIMRLVDASRDGNKAEIESNWLSLSGAARRIINNNLS
jgi:hypothetical protein